MATTANEAQLRQALKQQVRFSDMQNGALKELTKQVGAAGALIERMKKTLKKPIPAEQTVTELQDMLDDFEKKAARKKEGTR